MQEEVALLRKHYPSLEFAEQGQWFRIPNYSLPSTMAWSPKSIDVAFQAQSTYPATSPYGIYVKEGLAFNGSSPNNYAFPASQQPPFEGKWGILSWAVEEGQWKPSSSVGTGSNLLNFVLSFGDRFRQGA